MCVPGYNQPYFTHVFGSPSATFFKKKGLVVMLLLLLFIPHKSLDVVTDRVCQTNFTNIVPTFLMH